MQVIRKEIEQYGVLKITDKGMDYIENPTSFMMTEDHLYDETDDTSIIVNAKGGGAEQMKIGKTFKRFTKKSVAKRRSSSLCRFSRSVLDDMALKYPITMDELQKYHGVGEGKAKKFGKAFVELIAKYVEENDIIRPDDFIVKSTGVNSGLKLYIIQNTDRKFR